MKPILYISRAVTVLTIAVLLTSCGGFFPASNQIVSLQLSPTSAWIKPRTTQQFTATATFGNNTTGDVTSQVSWNSGSGSIATINSAGIATGVAPGSTTITAKSNNSSVTATAQMTVSNKIITAITVSPQGASISLATGQTQQFTASATFSDGTFQDVTNTAAWTSSSPSIATVSNTGLASPVGTGTTVISASIGGVAGTTTFTITQ